MTQVTDMPDTKCARCGAELRPADAKICWLCYAPVEKHSDKAGVTDQDKRAAPAGIGARPEHAGGFSLASLMMFVTLVSVVFGLSTIAPGIGIPMGLVLLVVWLRTAEVVRRREARGLSVTWAERTQLFLASTGVAVGLIALTCVAGAAAFVAACFVCIATMGAGNEQIGGVIFVIVAAAILLLAFWRIAKVIRRRWRADIGEPD